MHGGVTARKDAGQLTEQTNVNQWDGCLLHSLSQDVLASSPSNSAFR
jgi:hypothetical protein